MNSEKELNRLTSLKIIEKRYSFLFEDVWFILLQYMYFEKFLIINTYYLADTAGKIHLVALFNIVRYFRAEPVSLEQYGEYLISLMKPFGFISFNVIFTALVGLGGLTTINHCLKMIKQGKTKTKIFYLLTLIQIFLQIFFPFMRAWIVILGVFLGDSKHIKHCLLVGFQFHSVRIKLFV